MKYSICSSLSKDILSYKLHQIGKDFLLQYLEERRARICTEVIGLINQKPTVLCLHITVKIKLKNKRLCHTALCEIQSIIFGTSKYIRANLSLQASHGRILLFNLGGCGGKESMTLVNTINLHFFNQRTIRNNGLVESNKSSIPLLFM